MAGYYELKQATDGQYHFVLKAENYQTILSSERYTTKQGAEGGIQSCKVNSPNRDRYDRLTATDGSPYFVLQAANGQVIGTSETYTSSAARDQGIASVMKNGQGHTIQR